ncbi:hypothetical protein ACQ4PT_067088 [Festuca glaucescens]
MAASKRRRSCTDDLPEEVLHEVFSHVGNVKDLFRLAMTCRRWLRHFTDPTFLHGLSRTQGHRARLLGFFFCKSKGRERSLGCDDQLITGSSHIYSMPCIQDRYRS